MKQEMWSFALLEKAKQLQPPWAGDRKPETKDPDRFFANMQEEMQRSRLKPRPLARGSFRGLALPTTGGSSLFHWWPWGRGGTGAYLVQLTISMAILLLTPDLAGH